MNTKRHIFLLCSSWLIFWGSLSFAQQPWIEQVTAMTIDGYFKKAEALVNQKIAETDSALAPCLYLASVLNSRMTHYESNDQAGRFTRLLHFIINKANQQLDQPNLSDSLLARLYFYRGSAYGYLGFFQGQNGQWFKALKNGLKAIDDLTACTKLDSTLFEAYLGLGTYKYWRSTKLKAVLWLPFLKDLREEGIADIKRAMRTSSNSRYMALHQLVYILIDYKHYAEAQKYAEQGIQKFPQSQFMWWAYAHVFFKSHQYHQAIKAYKHLLKLIESHPESNPSHWLDCQVRLAEVYKRLGQTQQAKQLARLILKHQKDFPDTEKNRQRLAHARELLNS